MPRALFVFIFLCASALFAAEENSAGVNLLDVAKKEFNAEHFDAALSAINEIEKRGEQTAKSFELKGRVFLEQQKYDEAKAAFETSHSLDATSFGRLYLAGMYLREKKWGEARETYELASKETNVLLSNERFRYGQLVAALAAKDEEHSRVAFENIPFPTESPAYYYAQAAWSFAHDQKSDGEKWIRRAEEIYPIEKTAWFARPLYDLGWIKKKPPLIAD